MNKSYKNNKYQINTIKNNGMADGFTNSCMFISIRDYLVRNSISITVTELRNIGNFPGGNNDMFDDSNIGHIQCLETICKRFGLKINIQSSTNIDCIASIGKGNKIVKILQLPGHFELIDESELDKNKTIEIQLKKYYDRTKTISDEISKLDAENNVDFVIIAQLTEELASQKMILKELENEIRNCRDSILSYDFILTEQNDNLEIIFSQKLVISNDMESYDQNRTDCLNVIKSLESRISRTSTNVEKRNNVIKNYKELNHIIESINNSFIE